MLHEKHLMEAHYTQELLKTRLEVQEETFRHISQEIHDNIGQTLTLLKLTISTTRYEEPEHVKSSLENSKLIVTKAIKDLRSIAHNLSPDFLEKTGLPELIKYQLQQLEGTGEYKTSFSTIGDQKEKQPQKELVLLRIVQELLHNIVKHANATEISVNMEFVEDKLRITVSDNGQGFDAEGLKQNQNQGIGLTNIRNRIKMIGGNLNIESYSQQGCKAVIEI